MDTNRSFLPSSMQVLSGSALKVIATVCMLIDHIGAHLLRTFPPALQVLFTTPWESWTLYSLSRSIGRIAFPIYCFLLVEGFYHTRDRIRYGRNLLLFALLSEPAWNFVHSGTLFYRGQNVFFTLFFGYAAFCALEYFKDRRLLQFISVFAIIWGARYFHADYGWKGVVFLLIMYGLSEQRTLQALVGGSWLLYEWKAVFAFLPINMYNGKRGFIKGKAAKYGFYAFYPVHLLILGLLKYGFL